MSSMDRNLDGAGNIRARTDQQRISMAPKDNHDYVYSMNLK